MDHTLFAKVERRVDFKRKGAEQRVYVSVVPETRAETARCRFVTNPGLCRGFRFVERRPKRP